MFVSKPAVSKLLLIQHFCNFVSLNSQKVILSYKSRVGQKPVTIDLLSLIHFVWAITLITELELSGYLSKAILYFRQFLLVPHLGSSFFLSFDNLIPFLNSCLPKLQGLAVYLYKPHFSLQTSFSLSPINHCFLYRRAPIISGSFYRSRTLGLHYSCLSTTRCQIWILIYRNCRFLQISFLNQIIVCRYHFSSSLKNSIQSGLFSFSNKHLGQNRRFFLGLALTVTYMKRLAFRSTFLSSYKCL